jgi:hypothetical protein
MFRDVIVKLGALRNRKEENHATKFNQKSDSTKNVHTQNNEPYTQRV